MNTPFKPKCDSFHLAYINEVNEYLSQGFELYGPTLYDPVKQTFCQPLAKYQSKRIQKIPLLMPREKKCFQYLVDGVPRKVIATRIYRSLKTVHKMIDELKQKLEVSSSTD
jgi:DNA-binding NarL/FixJ family response regulator